MEGQARAGGTFGPGTAGETLQKAVFDGDVDPGNLVVVREILPPAAPDTGAIDTAVFSGPRAGYTISVVAGKLTVTDTAGTDGTDTLTGIERLRFSDTTVAVAAPTAPTGVSAVAGNGQATVSWAALPAGNPEGVTSFTVRVFNGTTQVGADITGIAANATSRVVTGLSNGTTYTFQVVAVNQFGSSTATTSNAVTPAGAAAPTVTTRAPAAGATGVALASNVTAAFSVPVRGVSGTSFRLQRLDAAGNPVGAFIGAVVTPLLGATVTSNATLNPNANLVAGTTYRATLTGGATAIRSAAGNVPLATTSWTFTTVATAPGAPVIGTATPGVAGGAITATAAWTPPANTGGSPITGYVVRALRMSAAGAVLATTTSAVQPATARSLQMTLPVTGNYRFTVQAVNAVGSGPQSARSNLVAGR
jgi:hypothetical protein